MTQRKQVVVRGRLRVQAYPVFSRALEEGIQIGWNRAHKHTDKPDEQTVQEEIHTAVMNSVCEMFDFGDE
jgi:hypothetical protein